MCTPGTQTGLTESEPPEEAGTAEKGERTGPDKGEEWMAGEGG